MATASDRTCAVASPLPFFVRRELRLVIAQLVEQAIAQVAAGDSGRIHLAHQIEGLVQILQLKLG